MERKGGCLLVPRYGPGGGAVGGQAPGTGVSWQMGKIMLKFRPIAPKPAAMAPAPVPVVASVASGRGKRKAASGGGGGGGGKRGRKSKKAATIAPATAAAVQAVGEEEESEKEKSLSTSRSSSSSAMTSVDSSSPPSPPPPAAPQPHQQPATLPLMLVSPSSEKVEEPAPLLAPAPPVAPRPTASSSSVTVADVTSTWRDGDAPSAASACVGADGDEAPSFVSDRWGRVTWANAAFTRAVSSDESAAGAVALAGSLPAWGTCAGFTCRIRVRHANPRPGGCVVAPCDVWRLDADGCYLWRLDLQAALTLGAGLP